MRMLISVLYKSGVERKFKSVRAPLKELQTMKKALEEITSKAYKENAGTVISIEDKRDNKKTTINVLDTSMISFKIIGFVGLSKLLTKKNIQRR